MAKQRMLFTRMLAPATVNSPLFTSSMVSKLKVENVESPPQKPVSSSGRTAEVEENEARSPKKKTVSAKTTQLTMLAVKVAQGKEKYCIRVNQAPNM